MVIKVIDNKINYWCVSLEFIFNFLWRTLIKVQRGDFREVCDSWDSQFNLTFLKLGWNFSFLVGFKETFFLKMYGSILGAVQKFYNGILFNFLTS